MTAMNTDLLHLHARSKADLLMLIHALVAEDPVLREAAARVDQRKAASRVVAIQQLLAANRRLHRRIAEASDRTHEVLELLRAVAPFAAATWVKSKERPRRQDPHDVA